MGFSFLAIAPPRFSPVFKGRTTINTTQPPAAPPGDAKERRPDGDRLQALERGALSHRPDPVRPESRGARVRVRSDLGPLPPVDRQARAQSVRVERAGRPG